MDEKQPQPQPGQMQIKADEKELQGLYSNLVMLQHNLEEFTINFVYIFPNGAQGKLLSSMIVSPGHAKRIWRALGENYIQIIQAKEHVALVMDESRESSRSTRKVNSERSCGSGTARREVTGKARHLSSRPAISTAARRVLRVPATHTTRWSPSVLLARRKA